MTDNNLSNTDSFNNVDVYKLAELKYGTQTKEQFPGEQLTHMNDFNNFCMNTCAEFIDPEVNSLYHSGAGQKCQTAMLQQLALNGRTLKAGNKLRMPVVLSRPQYYKDALLATKNPDEAYKICCNSCIVNSSDNTIHQTTCVQRCGDALNTIKLTDPKNLPVDIAEIIHRTSQEKSNGPPVQAASITVISDPINGIVPPENLTSDAAKSLQNNAVQQKLANQALGGRGPPAGPMMGRSAYNSTPTYAPIRGVTNVNKDTASTPIAPLLRKPKSDKKELYRNSLNRPNNNNSCWIIVCIIFVVILIFILLSSMGQPEPEITPLRTGSSFRFGISKKRLHKRV